MKRLMVLLVCLLLLAGCTVTNTPQATVVANTPEATAVANTPQATQEPTQAPAEAESTPWPRTVEDSFSHSVTLTGKPQRVVLLYFGHIDSLLTLDTVPVGTADAALAMNCFGTLAQYAGQVEIVDVGSATEPSMEKILELDPDLILGTAIHKDAYEELAKIAPTLLFNSADWKESLSSYALCFGEEEKAAKFIADVDALMAQSREALAAKEDKTFFVGFDYGNNTFMGLGTSAWTADTFFGKEKGLGLTAVSSQPETFGQITMETLAASDPDYIIISGRVGSADNDYQVTYLHDDTANSSVWKSLRAVQEGNVFYVDPACIAGTPQGIKLAIQTVMENVNK